MLSEGIRISKQRKDVSPLRWDSDFAYYSRNRRALIWKVVEVWSVDYKFCSLRQISAGGGGFVKVNNGFKTQSQLDFNQSAFEIDLDLFPNNEVMWTESSQVNGFNPHVHSESNSTLGQSTDQMNHLNSVNSNAHLSRWMDFDGDSGCYGGNIPAFKGRGRSKILVEEGSSYAGNPQKLFVIKAISIQNFIVLFTYSVASTF